MGLEQELCTASLTKPRSPPHQPDRAKRWAAQQKQMRGETVRRRDIYNTQVQAINTKKKKIIHTLCGLWTVLIQRHFSHQERKILLPKRYNKTLGERFSVYILIFNLTTTNAHAPRICRLLRIRAYTASPWDPTSLPEYEDLFCIPVWYKQGTPRKILSFAVSFLPLLRRKSNFPVQKVFWWETRINTRIYFSNFLLTKKNLNLI